MYIVQSIIHITKTRRNNTLHLNKTFVLRTNRNIIMDEKNCKGGINMLFGTHEINKHEQKTTASILLAAL